MSDTVITSASTDAPSNGVSAPVSPETSVPATQARTDSTTSTPAKESAPSDGGTAATMRQALLRAQVAQVLGAVQAPWVLDAAIAAAKPDLLADFTGLTGPSRERVAQWKAENAFAFAQSQAPSQAPQVPNMTQTPTSQAPATEPLPATPGSTTGATAGLSTDQLRRLGQVHVQPSSITSHPDWSRVKAFWGVA